MMKSFSSFLACICLVLFVFVAHLPSFSEQASFEDVRCKCVCPRELGINGTGPVYIANVEPNNCKCTDVVPRLQVDAGKPQQFDICNYCECKYESRNTTTIKVVVIFIICVVSLLFVYMLFLLCLDPLIQYRPAHYAEHTDEEVNLEDMSTARGADMHLAPAAPTSRQRSLLNRMTDEQKKWKGTVQEQRRNIYDRHTMLN